MNTQYLYLINIIKSKPNITIKKLAELLEKSERTVYTYIQNVNDELEDYGSQIISSYDKGYSLIIFDQEKFDSLDLNCVSNIDLNDKETRIKQLLYLLLKKQDYIKIEDLCESFNLSRSQMKNEIRKIRVLISRYDLSIESKPYYGIKLVGSEMGRRLCISHYCSENINFELFKNQEMSMKIIRNVVESCLINSGLKIIDESLDNLVLHLFIAIERIKMQSYVSLNSNILEEQKSHKIYEIAQNIIVLLSHIFEVEFDESECAYVTIHLRSKQVIDSQEYENANIEEVDILFNKMIDQINKIYAMDFSKNLDFVIAMHQHLIPLLVRIKYRTYLQNPMINEIKTNFILAFDLATQASFAINKAYDINLPEDEIGYIAIHIQLALEKSKMNTKRKILIVCSSGKGTANLLKIKFKRIFKDYLSEIVTCSVFDLNSVLDDSFDCIFTTVNIQLKTNLPIIKINNILDNNENDLLSTFLNVYNQSLKKYLRKELLLKNISFDNRDDALKYLIENIAKYYRIPQGFIESIYKREEINATEYGSVLALPHPILPMTEETFLSIMVLDKPIKWFNSKIQVIILLSVSDCQKENLDELYEFINYLINNRSLFNQFINEPSYEFLEDCFNRKKVDRL